ncbi:MAG: zf-HC2 domain-containing protein [bacterium]
MGERERSAAMTCAEVTEAATSYAEARLSPVETRRFRQHVERCPSCRTYLEQLDRARDALAQLPTHPVGEHVRSELLARFRASRRTDSATAAGTAPTPPDDESSGSAEA